MLAGACVCPHPPLLVPALAGIAAEETAELREACLECVADLVASGPELIVCVGAGEDLGEWDGSAGGTMRRYGVDVTAGGRDLGLPTALTVAAWLLDRAGWSGPRRYVAVPASASPQECADVGARVVDAADRVAILAMGDGSAKRSRTAPGYLDHRAAAFDADAVVALAGPDVEGLLAIPPLLADELWAAGRPAWQVLAGVARSTYGEGGAIRTTVRYDAAPYGVGYWVVAWEVDWATRRPATGQWSGR